jgi:hypothetical protein
MFHRTKAKGVARLILYGNSLTWVLKSWCWVQVRFPDTSLGWACSQMPTMREKTVPFLWTLSQNKGKKSKWKTISSFDWRGLRKYLQPEIRLCSEGNFESSVVPGKMKNWDSIILGPEVQLWWFKTRLKYSKKVYTWELQLLGYSSRPNSCERF